MRFSIHIVVVIVCALLFTNVVMAANRYVATTGADTGDCSNLLSPCLTLQYAVNQSAAADVIHMSAGTYAVAGLVTVNKTLTVQGSQAGVDARTRVAAESVLSNTWGIQVTADNVTFDGFTIQDSSNVAFTGFGIYLAAGINGTQIINNIIRNNITGVGLSNGGTTQCLIQHNLFQNNNLAGASTGLGIYTDEFVGGQVSNVLISENAFENNTNAGIGFATQDVNNPNSSISIINNGINNCGRGIYFFNTQSSSVTGNLITNLTAPGDGGSSTGIAIYGGVSNLSINDNEIQTGAAFGIRIAELIPNANSGIQIHHNNITGFGSAALHAADAPQSSTAYATCNWWRNSSGPTNAFNPGGTGEVVSGSLVLSDVFPWLSGLAPGGACILFSDDFEDGIKPAGWIFKGNWSEGQGSLNTVASKKKMKAIAVPVFSGCDSCSLETNALFEGQVFPDVSPTLSIVGWYQDKDNFVELLIKPTVGKLILKQKVNGAVATKTKVSASVAAGTPFTVQMDFDGSQFTVSLDGNQIMTLPKAIGSSPSGTIGYYVKATAGHFSYITVEQ